MGVEQGTEQVQGQAAEPTVTDPSQQTQERSNDNNNTGGTIYDQYLDRFPESLRPVATDIFKEWDAQTTKRFQDLHSEYEPWKPLAEQFQPDEVAQAIALAQALEANPQEFVDAVAKAYGITPAQAAQAIAAEQGVAGLEEETEQQFVTDPRIDQLEQALQTMANIMLQEREQQTHAQEDAQLDQVMTGLKQQHGDFDEEYVLTKIAQGVDPAQAVAQYNQAVERALAARNAIDAPTVMGSGGGLPTAQTSPSKLSSQDTQKLVAAMLEQQAKQNRG